MHTTPQTLGSFRLEQRLDGSRGELYRAVGAAGEPAVVRTVPRQDHEALDAALVGLRFDHPHLERILDAGSDAGVLWVARDDVPDPWDPAAPWKVQAARALAALEVLGVLDGVGKAHGRISEHNLRLREGHLVVVDMGGRGDAVQDLRALGDVLHGSVAEAPASYRSFVIDLRAGRWDRAVDARRMLEAIGVEPPELPAPASLRPSTLLALRPAPLRGRRSERAALEAVLARGAKEGCVGVLLANPGMGSSRLVHAVAAGAHRGGSSTSFRARRLPDLVDPDQGGDPERDEELKERLEHAHGASAANYARLRRHLGRRAGARLPVVVLDDAHYHPELFGFAHAWLASRQPGVLLLDCDATRVESDERLARALHALEEGGAEIVPLGPMEDRDLEDALSYLVPEMSELVRSAVSVGQGSPLDAHLALLTLLRTGEVPLDHSPWLAWLDVVLPTDDDRRFLEVAAALEDPLDPAEWTTAGSRLGLRWSKDLPRLLRLAGIGKRARGRWRLAHASLRGVLQATCREEGRLEDVHRACAEVVRGPQSAMRRGAHLVEAGDRDRAAEALLCALETDDPDVIEEVVTLLERTLADVPLDDPRRVSTGLARLRISHGARALEVGRQVARYGTTEDRFRVALHMVGELSPSARDEQDTWVARTFALARKLGCPEATGAAWQAQASVRLSRGDVAGAERSLGKALDLSADPKAQVLRAELLCTLGRNDEAEPLLASVRADDEHTEARLHAAWGHRAFVDGHIGRALLCYRAAEHVAEEAGQADPELMWHVGKALLLLGRVDEAAERFSLLVHETGQVAVAGHVGAMAVAAHRGEQHGAAQHLEWLDDHAEFVPDPGIGRLLEEILARVDRGLAIRIQGLSRRFMVMA